MRVFSAAFVSASLLLFSASAFATVHPHHHSSTQAILRHSSVSRSHHSERAVVTERFVPSISPERATEIQGALINRGYLTGTPSGTWDASSIAAMQKLQGDNGWQTKMIPDSRALIKLGLGPNSTPLSPSAAATTTTTAANSPTY